MNKLFLLLLTSALWQGSLPVQAEPVIPATAATQVVIQGQVLDAQTGLALDQVYIRQQDSLNSTFSRPTGLFELTLDGNFPAILVLSKDNYEPVALPAIEFKTGKPIRLQRLRTYQSTLPQAHSRPALPTTDLFQSQFSAFYQGHHGGYGYQGNNISGWALNELGLNMNLTLFKPWMIRGQLFRGRVPFNIDGFDYQPVFFTNNLQIKLGGGYMWQPQANLAFQLGADFLFLNRSPDNKNNQDRKPVPYTGSTFDVEHSRFALGANASLAWKINNSLLLVPEASLYPLVLGALRDDANNPVNLMLAGELGSRLYVHLIPGIAAVAHYQKQLWLGAGTLDSLDYFGIGLSINPWGMTWLAAPQP